MGRGTNEAGNTLQQAPEECENTIHKREDDIEECLNYGKEGLEDALSKVSIDPIPDPFAATVTVGRDKTGSSRCHMGSDLPEWCEICLQRGLPLSI